MVKWIEWCAGCKDWTEHVIEESAGRLVVTCNRCKTRRTTDGKEADTPGVETKTAAQTQATDES